MSTFHAGVCWFTVILERGVYTASCLSVCVCVREIDRETPPAMPVPPCPQLIWGRICRTPLCSPITETHGCSRNGPHTCGPCADYTPAGPVLSPFLTSPPASPTAHMDWAGQGHLSPCWLRCHPGGLPGVGEAAAGCQGQ